MLTPKFRKSPAAERIRRLLHTCVGSLKIPRKGGRHVLIEDPSLQSPRPCAVGFSYVQVRAYPRSAQDRSVLPGRRGAAKEASLLYPAVRTHIQTADPRRPLRCAGAGDLYTSPFPLFVQLYELEFCPLLRFQPQEEDRPAEHQVDAHAGRNTDHPPAKP